MNNANFLVIDDDTVFAGVLARGLTRRGYVVYEAHDGASALRLVNSIPFGQITVDLNLGTDSGLALIGTLRSVQPRARILVLTGFASIARTGGVRHARLASLHSPVVHVGLTTS